MRTQLRFILTARSVWGLLRRGGCWLVLVLASGLSAQAQCFQGPQNYEVGSTPFSVAIGDLNGDAKPDLVTANRNSDYVSVLLGDGRGSFGAATNYGVVTNPLSVAIGDLNGDAKPDLVTANAYSNNVLVLLGDGSGRFGAATDYGVGKNPCSVAIGDLNGDGNNDLVTANRDGNNVSVLLGDGSGRFGAASNYRVGNNPYSVAIGDLNGDGKADLVTASLTTNTVSVLPGDGSGRFETATTYGVGTSPLSVAIGDFNGDAKADLVTANVGNNTVSVLLGDGSGRFGAATDYGVGVGPYSVAIGDFNGDAKADLVTANWSTSTVSVLVGDGNGHFGAASSYGTGSRPYSVAIGDFNGDSRADLVTANSGRNNVSVLLSSSSPPSLSLSQATNPSTCGGADGSISFTTTNLTDGTYSLNYSVGGNNLTASITVSNNGFTLGSLGAGSYSGFNIASNGCVASLAGPITLTQPAQPSLAQSGATNPSCGGTNGSITFTTTNLTDGPYNLTYSVGGNNQTAAITVSNNGFSLGGLGAGSYSGFSITSNGCVTSLAGPITLTQPAQPTLTQNGTTNPSCGGTNGSLGFTTTNLANGTYSLTYSLGGNAQTANVTVSNNGFTLGSLAAGSYSGFSIASNGCVASLAGPITLTGPAQPSLAQGTVSNPTTCGGNQGSIAFATTNLTDGPYSLNYSVGGNNQTASITVSNNSFTLGSLAAGSYSGFSITSNGCVASLAGALTLTEPAQPTLAQGTLSNPSTCGGNQGSITFTTNLTDGPYSLTYSVGGNAQTAKITVSNNGFSLGGLGAGSYSGFSITSSGCVASLAGPIILTQPAPPTLTQKTVSNPTTCGGNQGSITFTTSLANGTYSLSYSVGSNNPTASITVSNNSFTLGSLAAGSYSGFSITSSGCVASLAGPITLTAPTPPTASLTNNGPITCAKPSVTLTAGGGSTYQFSQGATQINNGNTATVNAPGVYSVTVTATNGCTATASVTVTATAPAPDYQALVDLYNNTNGPTWARRAKWLTSCSPCGWEGVTCGANGRVTTLKLNANKLKGTLPASLSALSNLQVLNLGSNQLSGTIPASLSALANLQILELPLNQFSGTIPPELTRLTKLQGLNLSHNQLDGAIPSGLGSLTSLQYVYLNNNQLTGSIPGSVGNLSDLQLLVMTSNQLSGPVPPSLGRLTKLKGLYLNDNQLTETIPSEIGNLTQLLFLYLNNNRLSGSIPASLGNLRKLTFLVLSSNQLSGCIPASLSALCGRIVDLSKNTALPGGGNFAAFCKDGTGSCTASGARLATAEEQSPLEVIIKGNPITGSEVVVEVRGAGGQPLTFRLWDLKGELVSERHLHQAGSVEQQTLPVKQGAPGVLLLWVNTPTRTQAIKVLKP